MLLAPPGNASYTPAATSAPNTSPATRPTASAFSLRIALSVTKPSVVLDARYESTMLRTYATTPTSRNKTATATPAREVAPRSGRRSSGTSATRAPPPTSTPVQPCKFTTSGERLSPSGHFHTPLIHEGNRDFAIKNAPNGINDAAPRIKIAAPTTRHMRGPR